MCNYLVDTNIIIYHLSGNLEASEFMLKNMDKISISFVTYIEVLSYNFNSKEEKMVRSFLKVFKLIGMDKKIAECSIELRKTKKLKLPDCIIASTAKSKKLVLVTRNIKDFSNIGLDILNPIL